MQRTKSFIAAMLSVAVTCCMVFAVSLTFAGFRAGAAEGTAVVSAPVEVSPTFLSWVMGFGSKMRILSPPQAREALTALCRETLAQYEAP